MLPISSDSLKSPYRNPSLTVEERVADLLGRMTLEEKVGQIMLWDARPEDLSFINSMCSRGEQRMTLMV